MASAHCFREGNKAGSLNCAPRRKVEGGSGSDIRRPAHEGENPMRNFVIWTALAVAMSAAPAAVIDFRWFPGAEHQQARAAEAMGLSGNVQRAAPSLDGGDSGYDAFLDENGNEVDENGNELNPVVDPRTITGPIIDPYPKPLDGGDSGYDTFLDENGNEVDENGNELNPVVDPRTITDPLYSESSN